MDQFSNSGFQDLFIVIKVLQTSEELLLMWVLSTDLLDLKLKIKSKICLLNGKQ